MKGGKEWKGDEPVERLQACALLHAGMERDDVEAEQGEQRLQATDAVDRGEEDDRAAGVAQKKVVQVHVLPTKLVSVGRFAL